MDHTYWVERCRELKKNNEHLPEVLLEGRGPLGVSVIVRVKVIDEMKTAADMAVFFAKHQGRLGERVRWLFREKGEILVSKYYSGQTEDAIMLAALSVGAEDVEFGEGDVVRIICAAGKLDNIAELLEFEDVQITAQRLCYQPQDVFRFYEQEDIETIVAFMEDLLAREEVLDIAADFSLDDVICKRLGYDVY